MTKDTNNSRIALIEHMISVLGPLTKTDLTKFTGSVAQLASELKVSFDVLMQQLEEAGIRGLGANDLITLGDRLVLLDALKTPHPGETKSSESLYQQRIITPDQLIFVEDINDRLLLAIARTPELIYELAPRKFEELVARMFSDYGFDVELTPATRDGGYDIFATLNNAASSFIALVECKRYAPSKPVGVEIVRGLYGVTEREGANKGLVVTSSSFTRGAIEEKARIGSRMELKDYTTLTTWLRKYTR